MSTDSPLAAVDLAAAADFLATHGRLLDRRRFDLLTGEGDGDAVLAALDGYRNPDGGYGWGLEPDLRSRESQPAAALHAFEVLAELGPQTTARAAALCDWLDSVSLPDGGLPFALPLTSEAGCAPWWRDADPSSSSLQITTITVANAHRVAAHDAGVAEHPWLERATRFCLRAIADLDGPPSAYVLGFSIRFLDAVHDRHPEAGRLLDGLAAHVPADGRVPVLAGAPDEALKPLDYTKHPGLPSRRLLAQDVVARDLERLAALQQDDGGWVVDFASSSPAGALEWRGYATVDAIDVLRRNAGAQG